MAYSLTFFCRSEQEKGSTALASFLPKLTETGDRVLIKHPAADYADQVDACELATDNYSEMPAGRLARPAVLCRRQVQRRQRDPGRSRRRARHLGKRPPGRAATDRQRH